MSSEMDLAREAARQRIREVEGRLKQAESARRSGRVLEVTGTLIRAAVPNARLGEVWKVDRDGAEPLEVEVVGFNERGVLMMPLGPLESITAQAHVSPSQGMHLVPAGAKVRGRVLDALGRPTDGLGELPRDVDWVPMMASPPNAMTRKRVTEALSTGVRAIDGVLTVGRGQRMGIFAGAGGGKSTLLSMITRCSRADSIVVALIGERGREVRDFIDLSLGPEGLARCTLVVSTSDQPAVMRLKAAYTATAIAEHAREQGQNVVLLMDSVTRFARALREVGLAAGEPPGRQGFPASVFAALPRLLERSGNDASGSITAFYTILVEGEDIDADVVADEVKSLLDGHILLSPSVRQYPRIDVTRSKSRVMGDIVTKEHAESARRLSDLVRVYQENYDKISLGVYQRGADPEVDAAIRLMPQIRAYLTQDLAEEATLEGSIQRLRGVFGGPAERR